MVTRLFVQFWKYLKRTHAFMGWFGPPSLTCRWMTSCWRLFLLGGAPTPIPPHMLGELGFTLGHFAFTGFQIVEEMYDEFFLTTASLWIRRCPTLCCFLFQRWGSLQLTTQPICLCFWYAGYIAKLHRLFQYSAWDLSDGCGIGQRQEI